MIALKGVNYLSFFEIAFLEKRKLEKESMFKLISLSSTATEDITIPLVIIKERKLKILMILTLHSINTEIHITPTTLEKNGKMHV